MPVLEGPLSGPKQSWLPKRRTADPNRSSTHPSSQIGSYGILAGDRLYSGLILAARITLAHLSVSSAIAFPK
jgi:hypothetical protein